MGNTRFAASPLEVMMRAAHAFLVPMLPVAMFATAPTIAASLPDTGSTKCSDATNALGPCTEANSGDAALNPRQDGRFGRDAKAAAGTLAKVGGGDAGFDYSKIANDGSVLAANATLGSGATDWACTRDNITGLVWEVKTADGGLRDLNWTYTWLDSNSTTNGSFPGSPGGGACKSSGRCDTEKFVQDVNSGTGLCGFTDWRMPSQRELFSIAHLGRPSPAIDTTYFPNTSNGEQWTASTDISSQNIAWTIVVSNAGTGFQQKTLALRVRLVRGARF